MCAEFLFPFNPMAYFAAELYWWCLIQVHLNHPKCLLRIFGLQLFVKDEFSIGSF